MHAEHASLLLPARSCSLQSFPPPFLGCLSSASFLLSPRGLGHAWVISGFCNNDIETARWCRGVMHFSGQSPCWSLCPLLALSPTAAPWSSHLVLVFRHNSHRQGPEQDERWSEVGQHLHAVAGRGGKSLGLCWQREAGCLVRVPHKPGPKSWGSSGQRSNNVGTRDNI